MELLSRDRGEKTSRIRINLPKLERSNVPEEGGINSNRGSIYEEIEMIN